MGRISHLSQVRDDRVGENAPAQAVLGIFEQGQNFGSFGLSGTGCARSFTRCVIDGGLRNGAGRQRRSAFGGQKLLK